MDIFAKIAERKIQEALDNGEFDDLPNAGKPLRFDDDSHVPEDLRMAYRVLKNSGCVPPELDLRNEIISLKEMILGIDDDRERLNKIRELNFKLLRINELRKKPFNFEDFPEYEEKVYRKFL
ncbi:MAG: DnaJ family domain-containing protein [bacterium]